MDVPASGAEAADDSEDWTAVVTNAPLPPPAQQRWRVIIGTSGSLDFLNDATSTRRFWPGYLPRPLRGTREEIR